MLGRKNDRRQAKIQTELKQAERKHRKTGRAAPLFKEFDYQTCETAELSAFEVFAVAFSGWRMWLSHESWRCGWTLRETVQSVPPVRIQGGLGGGRQPLAALMERFFSPCRKKSCPF